MRAIPRAIPRDRDPAYDFFFPIFFFSYFRKFFFVYFRVKNFKKTVTNVRPSFTAFYKLYRKSKRDITSLFESHLDAL